MSYSVSGKLAGRVVIVTGAGRGLGRAHAIAMAQQGAAVVVNDLGVGVDGADSEEFPAREVVAEIQRQGGQAVASQHDVSNWAAAGELIRLAVETFGHLDVLVNNAGILRDRTLANMLEMEWDDVIRVHLKGHAAAMKHAMAYWRAQSKAGEQRNAAIINTTSVSGLFPVFGQGNYAAAKAGIVALTQVAALEGRAFGVRVNAVSPSANTRLVQSSAISVDNTQYGPADLAPQTVSPLLVWLAQRDCPVSGQVYQVYARRIGVYRIAEFASVVIAPEDWTLPAVERLLPGTDVPAVTAEDAIAILLRAK